MSLPDPIAVMEQWLRDAPGAPATQIAMALGSKPATHSEAVEMICAWIRESREPFAQRAAVVSLRAFIDFECAVGSSSAHQDMIDTDLLGAVDAAVIPAKNRAAINEALGDRPQRRQQSMEAAAKWSSARPVDQAIYDWWMQRTQDWLRSLSQPPNQ